MSIVPAVSVIVEPVVSLLSIGVSGVHWWCLARYQARGRGLSLVSVRQSCELVIHQM